MNPLAVIFQVLAAMLAAYVVMSIWSGGVWALRGTRPEHVVRGEEPLWFWALIVLYSCLAAGLASVL
ncbi:hypothetical protein [Xenophilus azovorans]|uniref:hypothetical protein n=1 Tax=Xenophilus azovorans TaxID=151755 RepID=UPI00056F3CBC|nr:hypothetical protein [Xenophilus azovorans]